MSGYLKISGVDGFSRGGAYYSLQTFTCKRFADDTATETHHVFMLNESTQVGTHYLDFTQEVFFTLRQCYLTLSFNPITGVPYTDSKVYTKLPFGGFAWKHYGTDGMTRDPEEMPAPQYSTFLSPIFHDEAAGDDAGSPISTANTLHITAGVREDSTDPAIPLWFGNQQLKLIKIVACDDYSEARGRYNRRFTVLALGVD